MMRPSWFKISVRRARGRQLRSGGLFQSPGIVGAVYPYEAIQRIY
jgi:hypothetical protein